MGILDFFNRPKLTKDEINNLKELERKKYVEKRKKEIEEKYS